MRPEGICATMSHKLAWSHSVEILKKARQLFLHIQIEKEDQWLPNFKLPWSHYIILLREKKRRQGLWIRFSDPLTK